MVDSTQQGIDETQQEEVPATGCTAAPEDTVAKRNNYKEKDLEKYWTDAQVRWTAANHNLEDDKSEQDENDSHSTFEPEPKQVFEHRFSHPSDPDKVFTVDLRGYESDSDTIYVSTGLTLWRSSELLCEYMMQFFKESMLPSRVLELGSGLGLTGILASQLLQSQGRACPEDGDGATCEGWESQVKSSVYLTDGDTNALSVLRGNVKRNIEGSIDAGSWCNVDVIVEQLIWGESTATQFLTKQRHEKFDLILAADAIYVLENVKPLLQTVLTLLRSNGEFWFSYCARRQVSVQIQDVIQIATEMGFIHRQVMEDQDILVFVFQHAPALQLHG